jgi:hypothetical protein
LQNLEDNLNYSVTASDVFGKEHIDEDAFEPAEVDLHFDNNQDAEFDSILLIREMEIHHSQLKVIEPVNIHYLQVAMALS